MLSKVFNVNIQNVKTKEEREISGGECERNENNVLACHRTKRSDGKLDRDALRVCLGNGSWRITQG